MLRWILPPVDNPPKPLDLRNLGVGGYFDGGIKGSACEASWGLILSVRKIVLVHLKENAFVLPSGGGRNIIVMFLQPIEDFFGGLVVRLSAFGV